MKYRIFALLCGVLAGRLASAERLDLAGEWRFRLDPGNSGLSSHWETQPLPETVRLPGCLQEQGFGNVPGPDTVWWAGWKNRERIEADFDFLQQYSSPTNFRITAFLQPARHYIGPAWYARDVEIPDRWQGQRILLRLERCHWETRLWVDGEPAGRQDGLAVAHEFDLTQPLTPGKHRLVLRVDNGTIVDIGGNCHSGSDQTQGTWNGVVGRIELRTTPKVWLSDVQVFPNLAARSAKVVLTIQNLLSGRGEGTLTLQASSFNTDRIHQVPPRRFDVPIGLGESRVEVDYPLGDTAQLWDEFRPALYRLQVSLAGAIVDRSAEDAAEVTFGLREFKVQGTRFMLNGRPVFLRGSADCALFPKTGYAPMDVESWRRVWRVYRDFGLNHARFHSWCPPEAAFAAADEAGLLLAPEVGEWTQVTTLEQEEFFRRESAAMLRQFGNHPSFVMMALGNERGGTKGIFTRLVTGWKEDRRRVYSIKANSGANPPEVDYLTLLSVGQDRVRYQSGWPPKPGDTLLQDRAPQTARDWRAAVSRSDKPLLAHETGQFCAYPDVAGEPARFTGYLKPAYLAIARDQLIERGMLVQVPDFVRASGRWQLALYKEEVEAHLRTPGLAGFHLLALSDFTGQGTAPVGLCDALFHAKPYLQAAEFRRFCAPTVFLARLAKRVWTTAETFAADLEVFHFGEAPAEWKGMKAVVSAADGRVLAEQNLSPRTFGITNCQPVGRIELALAGMAAPARYRLTVSTPGGEVGNDWEFWVYPDRLPPAPTHHVRLVKQFDAATRKALADGEAVLLLPAQDTLKGSLPMCFTTFYWTPFGLHGGQSSACGLLCDPKHAAFAEFPTDSHANWQWWELLTRARPMILDGPGEARPFPKDHRPLIQMIDGWKVNRKLAVLVEGRIGEGRLAICSMDIETDLARRPVARQLRRSLLRYLGSAAFQPRQRLTPEMVESLFGHPGGARAEIDRVPAGGLPKGG